MTACSIATQGESPSGSCQGGLMKSQHNASRRRPKRPTTGTGLWMHSTSKFNQSLTAPPFSRQPTLNEWHNRPSIPKPVNQTDLGPRQLPLHPAGQHLECRLAMCFGFGRCESELLRVVCETEDARSGLVGALGVLLSYPHNWAVLRFF